MHRRQLTALMIAAFLGASPATAQSMEQLLVSQLRTQGFTRIEVSTTWLGRTRIVAESSNQRREIIFNPRTGEILRDFWRRSDGKSGGGILSSGGGSSGPGSGDDEDDDEDEDDDDDDEDNSGKG
jgi:uncharacterized membrane protein YgcG